MAEVKRIKEYMVHADPAKDRWGLALELEDGSKPDMLRMNSATELAAMLDILRHYRNVMFYPDTGIIEIHSVITGESAGGGRE